MLLSELNLNRQGYKTPQQTSGTEDATFVSNNPARQSNPQTNLNKYNQQNSEYGAPNIYTGTVITSCFIQTTALPNRIEIAGNDITFYDDTYVVGGVVKGDTSRLIFTHDLSADQGFIMEKRASVYNTYDNVLSWYATPASEPSGTQTHNYMFIGREGRSSNAQRNVDSIVFNVDNKTALGAFNGLNGTFKLEYSEDGVFVSGGNPIFAGNSKEINPAIPGFSSYIAAGYGGLSGIGYRSGAAVAIIFYAESATSVKYGARLSADSDGRLAVGSVTDAGPMTNTNGIVGDIVFNTSNNKFYGCIATGNPATWSALN